MRFPDAEILFARFAQEVRPAARGASQDRIDERSISRPGEGYRFENCRMLRSFEQEQLIKPEPQKIARLLIEMPGSQRLGPEVEKRQVAQDAVEKLGGKTAINRRKIARSQELPENRVGELFDSAPFLQCDESEAA